MPQKLVGETAHVLGEPIGVSGNHGSDLFVALLTIRRREGCSYRDLERIGAGAERKDGQKPGARTQREVGRAQSRAQAARNLLPRGIDRLTVLSGDGWLPAPHNWAVPGPDALCLAGPLGSAALTAPEGGHG